MARGRIRVAPGETVLEIQRSRQTGVNVSVDYWPDVDPVQPWQTTCWTHGGVCSHETRTLAESFARAPAEWCEDCMELFDELVARDAGGELSG